MKEYEKSEEEAAQLGQETGAKFDGGKSRWDLMPADVLIELTKEFTTFTGLFELEYKLETWDEKMIFHYSNGMEAAWNFWNGTEEIPLSAGVKNPLIFAAISYIHLLDLCLIFEKEDRDKLLVERTVLFANVIPQASAMYLMPYRVLDYLGSIYLYGCNKYDENNWRKGMKWGKIFGAFCRHSGQWHGGERFDKESGMHHIGHALWQLFALRWYQKFKPDYDDRWIERNPEKLGVMNSK